MLENLTFFSMKTIVKSIKIIYNGYARKHFQSDYILELSEQSLSLLSTQKYLYTLILF